MTIDGFAEPALAEPMQDLALEPAPVVQAQDEQPIEPEGALAGLVSDPSRESLAEQLAAGFASLHRSFDEKLAYDRFKEQQIDRLHGELQDYKNDLLRRALQPLLAGLIRLHDDLGKQAALLTELANGADPQRFARCLAGLREDVELLLEQYGVARYEAVGETFDGRRQTVARTVPAAEPAQVGRLAERLRPGFELGELVLQKERVAVFVAPPNPPSNPEGEA